MQAPWSGRIPSIVLREPEDTLLEALNEVEAWLVAHPVAVRAIVRALVSEGERFAETAAGAAFRARLADSDLLRRARVLWDSSILSSLDAQGEPPLPSAVVDALLGGLAASDLRSVLTRLNERGLRDA